MKAVEFVKKNGIEKSKIHLDKMKQERWINSFFNDLKQIVDAFELVERFGGIDMAKTCECEEFEWGRTRYNMELMNAVNLVEQCQ